MRSFLFLAFMALCFFPASARADCSDPAGTAGTMDYFGAPENAFKFCNGMEWVAMGASDTLANLGCSENQVPRYEEDGWSCAEGSSLADPPVCSGANAALQWNGTAWNCATIAGGGGGGGLWLFNNHHSQQECVDAGGIINLSDFGGAILCTFSGMTCPTEWTEYGQWYRTQKTCTGTGTCGTNCTLAAGWFTTTAKRTCSYKNSSGSGAFCNQASATCTQNAGAGVTTVACY